MAGVPLLTFDLVWAAAVWAAVAAIAVANGGQLSRPPQSAAQVERARAPAPAAAAEAR